ncbi:myb/SANT-like DNA-binding domain-containing protein [Phthorimaea operculella]|nr:myb/SANT-like DNA-binding domain-containing protein [Phthorimaea operculella]
MDEHAEETPKQRHLMHPSKQQKKRLLEIITKHPLVIQGKTTDDFSLADARTVWQKITLELNAFPDGTRRTWKQWRKTWQDMYSKFKKLQQERPGAVPRSVLTLTTAEQEALGFKQTHSTRSHRKTRSKVNDVHVKDESEITLSDPEFSPDDKIFTASLNINNLRSALSSKHSQTLDLLAEQEQRKLELKQDFINFKKDYLRKKLKIMQEQSETLKVIARELNEM